MDRRGFGANLMHLCSEQYPDWWLYEGRHRMLVNFGEPFIYLIIMIHIESKVKKGKEKEKENYFLFS